MHLTKLLSCTALTALLSGGYLAHGTTVSSFADNFESGSLSQWTGKNAGPHSAYITLDPLNSSNHVLSFSQVIGAGDIFSINTLTTTSTFTVSFDYLGTPALGYPGNGGFFGISADFPGTHYWVAGTGNYPAPIQLIDDNTWHSYTLVFSSPIGVPVHLMFEDFLSPANNAFFDNISYHDTNVPPANPGSNVPDSGSTLALLTLAAGGIATVVRKSRR
jgi:hypothetical protein